MAFSKKQIFELKKRLASQDKRIDSELDKAQKKTKYGSKRTVVNGITFQSKAEATYYMRLKTLKDAGELLFFLRQVPIHLPGGVKYVVDFVEFYHDKVEFTDVKGFETDIFKLKRKMVEDLYPIKLKIVK